MRMRTNLAAIMAVAAATGIPTEVRSVPYPSGERTQFIPPPGYGKKGERVEGPGEPDLEDQLRWATIEYEKARTLTAKKKAGRKVDAIKRQMGLD